MGSWQLMHAAQRAAWHTHWRLKWIGLRSITRWKTRLFILMRGSNVQGVTASLVFISSDRNNVVSFYCLHDANVGSWPVAWLRATNMICAILFLEAPIWCGERPWVRLCLSFFLGACVLCKVGVFHGCGDPKDKQCGLHCRRRRHWNKFTW